MTQMNQVTINYCDCSFDYLIQCEECLEKKQEEFPNYNFNDKDRHLRHIRGKIRSLKSIIKRYEEHYQAVNPQ